MKVNRMGVDIMKKCFSYFSILRICKVFGDDPKPVWEVSLISEPPDGSLLER